MVVKKGNVQCRVVSIQTATHKKSKRNQRELTRDFKKNTVQRKNETTGENNLGMIMMILLRSFPKKDSYERISLQTCVESDHH